jgi:hypothetical protein
LRSMLECRSRQNASLGTSAPIERGLTL